jgi:hypothetical protein
VFIVISEKYLDIELLLNFTRYCSRDSQCTSFFFLIKLDFVRIYFLSNSFKKIMLLKFIKLIDLFVDLTN